MLIYVEVWNPSVAEVATVLSHSVLSCFENPHGWITKSGQEAWQTTQKGLSCFLQKPQL